MAAITLHPSPPTADASSAPDPYKAMHSIVGVRHAPMFDTIRLYVDAPDAVAECIVQWTTVPRWKTSRGSGNEWRFSFSASVTRFDAGLLNAPIDDTGFGSMNAAIDSVLEALLQYPPAMCAQRLVRFECMWKGQVIWAGQEQSVLAAILEFYPLRDLTDGGDSPNFGRTEQTASFCCQPTCARPATRRFVLRSGHDAFGRLYDHAAWTCGGSHTYYRQFCAEHCTRGDCTFDDCDDNMLETPMDAKITRRLAKLGV